MNRNAIFFIFLLTANPVSAATYDCYLVTDNPFAEVVDGAGGSFSQVGSSLSQVASDAVANCNREFERENRKFGKGICQHLVVQCQKGMSESPSLRTPPVYRLKRIGKPCAVTFCRFTNPESEEKESCTVDYPLADPASEPDRYQAQQLCLKEAQTAGWDFECAAEGRVPVYHCGCQFTDETPSNTSSRGME